MLAGLLGRCIVAKHRAVKYRRTFWQVRLELKHKVFGLLRDARFAWREFWFDFADWKEGKK